jgi:hypothetical protein
MRDALHIIYTQRADTRAEMELNALAAVYRFIFDCHAKKVAAEPGSSNDAAIVRHTEGVSHVEHRHDRSSQIT